MPPLYHIVRWLAKFLFWLLTRWQVKGQDNIPKEEPLLVVANHLNNADTPLLMASLTRGIFFMAKKELFRSWGRLAVKGVGAFPVQRGLVDRAALQRAINLLGQGKVVGVFPEGTRSLSGQLQRARPGVALIAYYSRARLLPMAITGTEKVAGAFWWLRRPRITVNIGQPFTLPPIPNSPGKETLAALTDTIMGRIAELLPLDYRGVYREKALAPSVAGGDHKRFKG